MNEMKQPGVRCESDGIQGEGLRGGKRSAGRTDLRLACLLWSAGSAALARHRGVLCSQGRKRSPTAWLGVPTGVRALARRPPPLIAKKLEQQRHPPGP